MKTLIIIDECTLASDGWNVDSVPYAVYDKPLEEVEKIVEMLNNKNPVKTENDPTYQIGKTLVLNHTPD